MASFWQPSANQDRPPRLAILMAELQSYFSMSPSHKLERGQVTPAVNNEQRMLLSNALKSDMGHVETIVPEPLSE